MKHDLPLPRTVATLPLSNTCRQTMLSQTNKSRRHLSAKQKSKREWKVVRFVKGVSCKNDERLNYRMLHLLGFQALVQSFNTCPLALGDLLTLDAVRVTVFVFERVTLIRLGRGSLLLSSCCSLWSRLSLTVLQG